jgi:WD40 repeat protein
VEPPVPQQNASSFVEQSNMFGIKTKDDFSAVFSSLQKQMNWKHEYRNLVEALPATPLLQLTDHTDEVLDLQFSPDGRLMASCSRDLRTLVYDVTWDKNPKTMKTSFGSDTSITLSLLFEFSRPTGR